MKKITLLVCAFMSLTIHAQTDAEKTITTVSKNNIEGHIYFLA